MRVVAIGTSAVSNSFPHFLHLLKAFEYLWKEHIFQGLALEAIVS